MRSWLTRLVGSRNQRLIRRYGLVVAAVNDIEPKVRALDDAALRAATAGFRQRLAAGTALDTLIPEAFAVVREAARRVLGLRHFDAQLIGGLVLHDGRIAEMRTGEGKTLVATLPAYLNALPGQGVHIVTVNEYLAGRDADWMAPVYRFLGLDVGVIRSGQSGAEKRAAYGADITYGTNHEFGFDYLRDNLAFHPEDQVQRPLAYAVVDEVDSILIDEARTPLLINGPSDDSASLYIKIDKLVPQLTRQARVPDQDDDGGPGDFAVDEKSRHVFLSETGHQRVEELLMSEGLLRDQETLYDPRNVRLMYHLTAALRAHALFRKDVDYIIRDGQVMIVNEFTGRALPGRRWSEGLHQAVEAKEGVSIQPENQTVASISFQNYFRLYQKLAGMTGTADTEAYEFEQIYGLEVVVIPTHRPMIRRDEPDLVYLTAKDKFEAIVEDIKDCRQRGQPVLVGTTSIETSEFLAALLDQHQVPHQVLNAKQHEREAQIVAEAGRPGMVTIATNMAGRGTDIVLGGNLESELAQLGADASEAARHSHLAEWQARHDQVVAAGGLRIIGTERHDSRRIDNQLRGRSGRQGDPGSSRFYISVEDHLMRIFGDQERTQSRLRSVGMKAGEAIESLMLTRQIQKAQSRIEAQNFDARKSLLWYDDVANEQRKAVYEQRHQLMTVSDISHALVDIRAEVVDRTISRFVPADTLPDHWDLAGLSAVLKLRYDVTMDLERLVREAPALEQSTLRARIIAAVEDLYLKKSSTRPQEEIRRIEKQVMLEILDRQWREHLAAMDYLHQGIHLRGLAHRNPKEEYKREAFELFTVMMRLVHRDVVRLLQKIQTAEDIRAEQERERIAEQERRALAARLQFRHDHGQRGTAAASAASGDAAGPVPPDASSDVATLLPEPASPRRPLAVVDAQVGRNEPCPCGSGKKYKQCHGQLK